MGALMFFIKGLLVWVLAGALARVLAGAGIALVTYTTLDGLVEGMLNQLVSLFAGVPSAALEIMLMAGAGDALSIIGSALMSVAALKAAGMVLGVKFS